MNRYVYDGPVMEFDTCVTRRWKASTYAVSEKKAKAILHIDSKANNKPTNLKITLPGKVIVQ